MRNSCSQVSGAFRSEQDILAVNFLSNGRLIRLRDIAQVRRSYADPPQPMFRVNGEPAIGLAIAMSEGGDILALGRNVKAEINDAITDLPLGIEPTLVSDQPAVVGTAIGEFMTSLWQAIAIIMAVSFVSLGVRAGAIVALSIPLTMAIVFPIMEWLGIDLQRISLGALIIALGLLVDDAMTTIDVMTSRLAQGDSKERAATFAYQTLAFPMLTGSFVTAAGFVPIGFARSAAGEYTFSIFAVVTVALIVSWFVAVLFAPLLGVALLKKPKPGTTDQPGTVVRIFRSHSGQRNAQAMVDHRGDGRVFCCCTPRVAICAAAILSGFRSSRTRRRPGTAGKRVDLRHRSGCQPARCAAQRRSRRRALEHLCRARRDPLLSSPRRAAAKGLVRPGRRGRQGRRRAQTAAGQARALSRRANARHRCPHITPRTGPPVGWPVQYRVQGPDIAQVRSIALRVAQTLGANAQVKDVNFDWIEPSRKVRISIDQDQARLLGLSSRALAEVLNGVMTGTTITQVRDNIYLVDVIARAQDEQRISLSTLQGLQLPLPNGRTVPLSQIASFEFVQEYPLVWRRQRVPTLTVQADVASGTTPEAAVQALAPEIAKLSKDLPKGYRIDVGGTVEESAQSQASVFDKVPLMLLLMVVFLMAQLHSFSRLALVLSVVPMGLIGIVIALLAFGQPLGFVAILGILALFGMIARNAVILIEQIETERAQRPQIWDAVVEATLSRFRPIMLTAISTVLGFIPIAPTVFWGPMAFAIMGGLFVATILTLIVLPALYITWFRVKEPTVGELAPVIA